jgi:DHA1 family bicyclomycin/chloramphenicol resistance-like MFS transporter
VAASLLCSIAPSVSALTALRFVQGAAGAAGIAIAIAIASDRYAGIAQARFFALLMLVTGLAPIVAPILGSQLLTFTSWRGVFVVLSLIGVGLLLAAAFGLDETLPPSRRQRGGIATSARAFQALLTNRRFVGYALTCGFAFAAAIVYLSVSPFVLQTNYGVSPQQLGIVFGVNALGLVLVSQISGKLVGRVSPQTLLKWGVAAIVVGATGLLLAVLSGIGLVGVLPSLFVIVASLGLIAPNASALALEGTQTAGSASALLGVLQFTIGAVVAPVVGIGGTTTAVPMAAVIATFGVATLVSFVVLCRPARLGA